MSNLRNIIAATDITHRGLIRGRNRDKWKEHYRNLKKGGFSVGIVGSVVEEGRTFIADVGKNEVKEGSYKFFPLLMTPVVASIIGGMRYVYATSIRIYSSSS